MDETTATRLAEPLARERVKTRSGSGRGGALSYLETHDVIRTANAIFGFGNWGHEVVELRHIETVTVHNSDKKAGVSVGYVCIVKVTVDGCIPVSGVGFGDGTEYRESGPVTAHELAAKEAESDALKRALKNFGDQFGLALYDKDAEKSDHITKTGAPKKQASTGSRSAAAAAEGPAAAADPVMGALHARILELAGELAADFLTVKKSIADNQVKGTVAQHFAWCERQIKTMEASVAAKKAEAASPFQPPAPKEQAA